MLETDVSNHGERILATDSIPLVRMHEERYLFASKFTSGKNVLDCACGTGYGSNILARSSRSVVGIDFSDTAVDFCEKSYAACNVQFQRGSALDLPCSSGNFDVYCSFETIEHVASPEKLVSEAKRVLKSRGLFIVSTPNRVTSGLSSGEPPKNPFHLVEWSLIEWDRILRTHFTEVSYLGQRVRCSNKFHPKYIESKAKRWFRVLDVVTIPVSPQNYLKFDSPRHWQPENLLAICRKA